MPIVTGTLKDIGLVSMSNRAPELVFEIDTVLATFDTGTIVPNEAIKVTPESDGTFSVYLISSLATNPYCPYRLTVNWNSRGMPHTASPSWRIVVPPEGGEIADLIAVVSPSQIITKGEPGDASPVTVAAAEAAATVRMNELVIERGIPEADDERLLRKIALTQYAIPFPDKDGYVAGGFLKDGTFKTALAPLLPLASIPARALGDDVGLKLISNAQGWAYSWVDRDGYVAFGIRANGQIYAPGISGGGGSTPSRTRIAASGDSLTAGGSLGSLWPDRDTTSWPARLQAALSGVTVFNRGTSGAPVDEINIRLGAKRLFVSGTIPATGAGALTTKMLVSWYPGRTTTMAGSLGGVAGTLTITSGAISFTRNGTGTAVTVTNTPFVSSWDVHSADTLIIFMGRNDINPGLTGMYSTVADHVVAAYVDAVDYAATVRKQVVVVGPIPETDNVSGSAEYQIVVEIGQRLKELYPNMYADLHHYLVNRAMDDLGLTKTTADNAAIAADTLPPSIMDDNTHYSRATAAVMATHFFAPYLTQKGLV